MPIPIDMTVESYMKMLENVGEAYDNRIHAQFVYVDNNKKHEWQQVTVDPSHVFKSILNLKARFENGEFSIKMYLSMSRRANPEDREGLLAASNGCMLDENKPFPGAEAWVIVYEWYSKYCLAIKIDEIKTRKASCVIEAREWWLMDQGMSVSERAMNRMWNNINK